MLSLIFYWLKKIICTELYNLYDFFKVLYFDQIYSVNMIIFHSIPYADISFSNFWQIDLFSSILMNLFFKKLKYYRFGKFLMKFYFTNFHQNVEYFEFRERNSGIFLFCFFFNLYIYSLLIYLHDFLFFQKFHPINFFQTSCEWSIQFYC